MHFYPSKNNDRLNRLPFQPEAIVGRVMVNPRYPIKQLAPAPEPWWCERCSTYHTFPRVRCDSGGFQDIDAGIRLLPWTALDAQLRLEEQLRWYIGDETFHFETIFIYDQMAGVDEAIVNGKKVKLRGTPETAAPAIFETLRVARYYSSQRHRIKGRIGFVGQGVDPDQYVWCARVLRHWMQPGDVFGYGGMCIWGRMPKRITEGARETISRVTPLLAAHGIRDFHMLGVMYAPGIEWVAELVRGINTPLPIPDRITFATDGSGPEQAGAIAGAVYEGGRQRHGVYTKEQKYKEYHPCDLALENIKSYSEWASSLS